MERSRKVKIVDDLHGALNDANMVVVTHHNGLTVAEATELRRSMRDVSASFRVTKNRLALRALDGTQYEGLRDLFNGPTAVTTSEDPVSAAKATVDYAKKNKKLVVIGGALGETRLDPDGVQQLSSLPSLDELRAKIVGMIQTPATRIAGVMQTPAGQLARVFSAYGDTGADG